MGSELMAQGLELMLVGMGTVFVFLTALVIATSAMSRLVLRFQPPAESSAEADEIAAIGAAIHQFRRRR